ncbi:hypothetical protein Angca_000786, partial [Angiostrongylus cantonensis]
WSSSRRLVITNNDPHIVSGGPLYRGNEQPPAAIFTSPYSPKGSGLPSTRAGFTSGRSYANSTYFSRNSIAPQRGGEH